MGIPITVDYRNIPPSMAIKAAIRQQAQKLEHFHPDIQNCDVTIEIPHRSGAGVRVRQYLVHLHLNLPGAALDVHYDTAEHGHEDLYVAIHDAFDIMTRQLQEQRQRNEARRAEVA